MHRDNLSEKRSGCRRKVRRGRVGEGREKVEEEGGGERGEGGEAAIEGAWG